MTTRSEIILKCTPAWVVAVDMGYGHQRPAHNLGCLAFQGKIINANNYKGIPASDRKIWKDSRTFYEWVSRFKSFPLIGEFVFNFYDSLQKIKPFYPKRDLSQPILQLHGMYHYIKKGWGRDLIEKLSLKKLPLITTFFAVAFMAEEHNYEGDIYCIVTDTDISRAWAPLHPHISRIKYFAPNKRTVERLKLYGVKAENIFFSGFPLPLENIGENLEIVRADVLERLAHLDPQKVYLSKYQHQLHSILKVSKVEYKTTRPFNLTFAVGGAGAQKDIAITVAKSLAKDLLNNRLHLHLVAGVHNEVATYFKKELTKLGLKKCIGDTVHILQASTKDEYFVMFNELMRKTDVLWTKPSELAFYSALGIPIIMSNPIGSQEDFNKTWLKTVGSGIAQEDPRYVNEWLWEWLETGALAEAAIEGYLDAPKFGTYNIGQIISSHPTQVKEEKISLIY